MRPMAPMGLRMLPMKFYFTKPSLPRQQNFGQNRLQLEFCKRYLQDVCIYSAVSGFSHRMLSIKFYVARSSLPWKRSL